MEIVCVEVTQVCMDFSAHCTLQHSHDYFLV